MLRTLVASFDPRRRRSRKYYLAFYMALIALGMALMVIYFLVDLVLGQVLNLHIAAADIEESSWFEALNWGVSIVVAVLGLAVIAQRCHDIGWPGWLALVALIPYLGIVFWLVLFFIPGTRGPNRYGPVPQDGPPDPA
ncbi:DUF805 domain-containing protein [Ferrovibrio xuzhouensis]|uniref:DUF805 domain-containing protein n=1 Tax=Ferrovibrio xuzhouensis TaxID=1576914 RepID=A0ABV7VDS7_9PROT